MNFAAVFINRPVGTTLGTLAVALSGWLAYLSLPVAPLPQVDFPTISVSASLPGASPETMAATVATPLERTLGRLSGVTEMTSTSTIGNTRINLQFDLSRDVDGAARDVQGAINAAQALLPTGMPAIPNFRKSNPADSPVLIMGLTSPILSAGELYDFATTVLAQKVSQVKGIGNVSVGGASLPAVRVTADLNALNRAGVDLAEVRQAVTTANVNGPKGFIEDGERRWKVSSSGQLSTAEEYMPIMVRYQSGSAIRLPDVAAVENSVQDELNFGTTNGKPSVVLVVFRQSGANIIEAVDGVKAMMPQLRALTPGTMELAITMERTVTIRASVREVQHSMLIAVALVVMVVFLFIRRVRATLIPGVAVPVSLLGTAGVMYLCGYSLDNLSLMALTIATGFVVDDAVVVLENIARHIEEGMPPMAAAIRGAREVTFTVISMSTSLIAVFIPILFMGGIVGRLFREFAVVLSVAIAVSLVVSLTVTPMMCAALLGKEKKDRRPGPLERFADHLFLRLQRLYASTLADALRFRWLTLAVFLACVFVTGWLYKGIPKGFFPQQDTGMLFGNITADQNISFQAMSEKVAAIAKIVQSDPAVTAVNASTGASTFMGGSRNSGGIFVTIKPPDQREEDLDAILGRLRGKVSKFPGASLFLQPGQDLRIGARSSSAMFQYTLQSSDLDLLREWEPQVREALQRLPQLTDVNSDFQDRGEITRLVVDRAAAARLGVTMQAVTAALNDAFGQRMISTIYAPLNQYRVVLAAGNVEDPNALEQLYLKAASGSLVPLSALARWEGGPAPLSVNHQGPFAALTISFNVLPGNAFSDVAQAITTAVNRLGVPGEIQRTFAGSAGAFQASLRSQPWLILAAVLIIYLVLGILYESFLHPITILSTLPSAGLGALAALSLCHMELSIMSFIGIFLLMGIVKKNAIIMIDFALAAERERDLSPRDAIFTACQLRLRPILMTTFAALFGTLPLAIGHGVGSELRQPLGVAVVGGLVMSQLLTLYTTPVVYLLLDSMRHRVLRRFRKASESTSYAS